jgi:hypothetical protein
MIDKICLAIGFCLSVAGTFYLCEVVERFIKRRFHKDPPAKSSWRYEIQLIVTKYNGDKFMGAVDTECNHPIGAYDKVVVDIANDICSRNEAKAIALFNIREIV